MPIDISELEKFIIKKLVKDVESEWGSAFDEDGPCTSDRVIALVGKWLCIKITANYSGSTMDQSTDRASGDPEDAHAWYDWIGLAETAPKSVKHPDELNEWAHLATYYRLTFRDVQYPAPFGHHSGRMVKNFTEKGIAELYVVTNRRFQDVSPITQTKEEVIDLNKGKEKRDPKSK